MRIQARLFMGTALLVLALVGVQWWLNLRQLRAMQQELGQVATTVGQQLLTGDSRMLVKRLIGADPGQVLESANAATAPGTDAATAHRAHDAVIAALPFPAGQRPDAEQRVEQTRTEVEIILSGTGHGKLDDDGEPCEAAGVVIVDVEGETAEPRVRRMVWHANGTTADAEEHLQEEVETVLSGTGQELRLIRHLDFKVEGEEHKDRFLVITGDADFEERVPIPVSPTIEVFQSTLRHGIGASAGLLAVGLVASGFLSRRLARPLQHLADGAELLGHGDLGVQVPETASGEVGELQRAFNRMSQRLAELEQEKESWRRREHLVQLGDLARGLAHTVRNPLNTLGLTVEELAGRSADGDRLVQTARAQIRRIDRWLRSFLALGAGHAAATEQTDLGSLVQSVALEAIQQGAPVQLHLPDDPVLVEVVPTALRAALANLLENAVQASPPGHQVEVTVAGTGEQAQVMLGDEGPGLPEEVRQRLFSPHVTTKVEGSGMGLFLAQQLVVSMHNGSLQVDDGRDGGTVVTVQLPLSPVHAHDQGDG